jgi:hypothetical protein
VGGGGERGRSWRGETKRNVKTKEQIGNKEIEKGEKDRKVAMKCVERRREGKGPTGRRAYMRSERK